MAEYEPRKEETPEPDEGKKSDLLEEPLLNSPNSLRNGEESKHEFSSPWEDSDLVLIIEDQKIHVHRVILQMTSPVLRHIFKETDSNEVPLLRTNVSDFVDLLRVIYPQLETKITLDNIKHIYKLAEQYQIESVMKVCRKYLVQVEKTTTNAMKILVIVQECDADTARKQCYEVLKGCTVAGLKSDDHFDDLDEQSLRSVLLPRAERLEKCLKGIQPQLVGLMDCVLYLWFHGENKHKMNGTPNQCPVHHSNNQTYTAMQNRIKCSACKEMFLQMARYSSRTEYYGSMKSTEHYYSSSGTYFDEKIVDVLQEMFSLLKM